MASNGTQPPLTPNPSLADDAALIAAFAEAAHNGQPLLQATSQLRVEANFGTLQMFSAREGLVAAVKLQPVTMLQVREVCAQRELLHQVLVASNWLPIAGCLVPGFCDYQWRQAPEGFGHRGGLAIDLWRTWLRRGGRGSSRAGFGSEVKLFQRGTWYPVQSIAASHGIISIKTLGPETMVAPETLVVWLEKYDLRQGQVSSGKG